MDWYERYKDELEKVFKDAKSIISSFPAPLDKHGLIYADKFDPINNSGHDYICTLLPFWIKDETGITDEQCRNLSLINIFLMLYFFIQDDCMDSSPSGDWKVQLALGNLLHFEGQRLLMSSFPADSLFWAHYNKYLEEWADSVVNEKSADFFITSPLKTAGKASPLKLTISAGCLLGGQPERIPLLEEAITLVLMTLQLSDDWFDWKEDLQDGSYNGLLAMIAHERSVSVSSLSMRDVEIEIFVNGCLNRYIMIAQQNDIILQSMNLSSSNLYCFHNYIVSSLSSISNHIDTKRNLLLKGGLNYYAASV